MSQPIVDAHTHLFSPEVIRQRADFAARDFWFGQLYADSSARLAGPDEILSSMDEAGIDVSVVCGFPWSDIGICRQENDYLAEVCRDSGGRLAFLGIVVPAEAGASAEAERCFALGAVGIGELNADGQGFDLDRPSEVAGLLECCHAFDKPVLLHASEPLGHAYPGKGSATPDKLVAWLSQWRDQPIVLAHWGGGLPFYELMPEVREVTRNVVYDSGASTYLYRQDVFQHVIRLAGQDRVMFGSDFPVLGQQRLLNRTRRQLDGDSALDAVLGGNATRVFGLESVNQ